MTFGLQCDEPSSAAILDRAAEGGVDFLDSSDAYPLGGELSTRGVTEEILGRWLRGKRDRFIVATKCFAPTGPAPFDAGNSRKHIMSAVEASLRRSKPRRATRACARVPGLPRSRHDRARSEPTARPFPGSEPITCGCGTYSTWPDRPAGLETVPGHDDLRIAE